MVTPLDLANQVKDAVQNGAWPALFLPQARDETGRPVTWTPGQLPDSEEPFRVDCVAIVGAYLQMAGRVAKVIETLHDPALATRVVSRREIARILSGRDPDSGEVLPDDLWKHAWP